MPDKDGNPIQRVQGYKNVDGQRVHFTADVIFIGGEPHAVLKWDGVLAKHLVKLDPSRLTKIALREADYLYDGPLE